MRRTVCAAACIALVALSAPTASSADVLDTYGDLIERTLSPAPLVPTAVPRSVAPIDRTITGSPSRRRSGYGLRLAHYGRYGPDAIVVLEGGSFKTVKAALRDARRTGFKARRTRVRGRRGYLLTRHLGPTQWVLVWLEDRRVYTLATGTPRKVSVKQLRSTAAGLEHLGRYYLGTHADPDNGSGGVAVTTQRTITTRIDWEAQCVAADGSPAGVYAGSAAATLIRRQANAFAFDIATHRIGSNPWTGSVTGTASPSGVGLTIQASGTIAGLSCDTGALSLTLDHFTGGPD
jgi:hypothetical protein